jgi:hypothetical protein
MAEFTDQLPLEAEHMPVPPEDTARMHPSQRRAFGSVPGLLGRQLDIPPFERLDGTSLELVEPESLRANLFGQQGRNAVDGIVLNAEQYTAIVRSPESFQSSIQAKTVAADRSVNPVRAVEKELKSGRDAFRQKWYKQRDVINGLEHEREVLHTLREWQKVPGFARTAEIDIVALANEALHGTINNMLQAYKDQHQQTPKEHHDMVNALYYRLFRGPQNDRIAYWGKTLEVADNYTTAVLFLFKGRQNKVNRFGTRLSQDLDDFYAKHGIFELK